MKKYIKVFGAREHNLKNIDIEIPKNQLTVITGISGSGKSSLAFDTIYAEGQRRYMESFSAYARQFMGNMERPDVDAIEGLSPVISIEQKTTNKNPRSTVGTVTEIYDFIRLLYASIGEAYSYNTGKKMIAYTEKEIIDEIISVYANEKINILAPIIKGRKGHYRELFEQLNKQGFVRLRIDGEVKEILPKMQLDRYKIHDIEIVVDRLTVNEENKQRLAESIQNALKHGKDILMISKMDVKEEPKLYSKLLMCAATGIAYDEPSPNSFSFNSPYGACNHCKGLGTEYAIDMEAILPDDSLSIQQGGIVPLGEEREGHTYQQATLVSKKYKFKLTDKVKDLPEKGLNMLLYGNENKIDIDINLDKKNELDFFEGVIPMVIRWFNTTSSDYVKRWAERFMSSQICSVCDGTRLKKESLFFKINNTNIATLSNMSIEELHEFFDKIEKKFSEKQHIISKDVLKEIRDRINFLLEVGLGYLSLSRNTRTLSGGESQRIRLATQIGSKLQGITYILDEPSIGLHQRDNQRLITSLKSLRNMGNTVIVVEHDKDIMLEADYLIDVGPKAGKFGGEIINQGNVKDFLKQKTPTSLFLLNKLKKEQNEIRNGNGNKIVLKKASGNNLKNINVEFPLGKFICVTGVSGSGKSTLINDTLFPILSKHVYKSKHKILPYSSVEGLEHIDKVIEIDQSPIGRSPRSNPATYCGFFTEIRQLFSIISEAKIRGYKPGRFSFNVKGGRCETCQGGGMKVIEMNFLPDVQVHCETCNGKRFNRETLEIKYRGKTIYDVLDMNVEEAVDFFKQLPILYRKVKALADVGLGYITLGQSAVTLSGGEAQRVKLATELSKKDTGKTFYILDEPTTGLHFQDIVLLMDVLQKLVDKGNTVLVIEHNMDVIKNADYIIDIGPEGGNKGGELVAFGTPNEIIKNKKSITGQYLKMELK